jgi:pathogenesis-related protein 1
MKILLIALLLNSSIAIGKEAFEVERDLWLETHNKAREEVGNGPLIWNMDLKRMAKKWALHLAGRKHLCDEKKLQLHHSPQRGDIGENIAASWGRKHPVSAPVEWWIKEKQWYDPKTNKCNPPAGKSCGHYTQVIAWRSTTVGCAKASCPGSDNITYYVCNYKKHGNMAGVHPIKGK